MPIVSFLQADVPAELRRQVIALQREAWPVSDPTEHTSAHDIALAPVSMLLVSGGRVLSALDILSKQIELEGERYAANGISTVVTDRALRSRGHGTELVTAAREQIARCGADLGIFTCDDELTAFYERAGWEVLVGTVLVGGTPEAPYPSDRLGKITMGSFFSAKARRRAAEFIGARIELYPGEVDRLW